MAYWEFDLTFTNLGALPEGSLVLVVRAMSSTGFEAVRFEMLSGSESLTLIPSTADPGGTILGDLPTFELDASDEVWFTVMLSNGSNTMTNLYSIGPYTVGDVGTEVAPEL